MDRMMQNLPGLNWANLERWVRNRLRVIFTRGDLTALLVTCLLLVVPVLASALLIIDYLLKRIANRMPQPANGQRRPPKKLNRN